MFMMVSGRVEDDSQVFSSAFQRDSEHRRNRRRGAGKLLPSVWNMSQGDLFNVCVYRVDLGWKSGLEIQTGKCALGADGWWTQPQSLVTSSGGVWIKGMSTVG